MESGWFNAHTKAVVTRSEREVRSGGSKFPKVGTCAFVTRDITLLLHD